MHKYKLKLPAHLIKAKGETDISEKGLTYSLDYTERIKSLSKNQGAFEATPEEVIAKISSNHPKRIIHPSMISCMLCQDQEIIEHAYSIDTYKPNIKNQILIAGDSHAEFYSRIPWDSSTEWSHACLWTGATTCLGFATDESSIEMILSTTKKLNQGQEKKFKLILSFGEIDVRHLFYSTIIVRKYFKRPSQYVEFIRPQLEKKIKSIKRLDSIEEIGLLQPTPATDLREHGNPGSTDELKNYYLKMGNHPILGTPEFRIECWEEMCNFIESFCDQNKLTYIRRHKESCTQSNLLNPKHTHDGCHLSSKAMLEYQYEQLKLISQ